MLRNIELIAGVWDDFGGVIATHCPWCNGPLERGPFVAWHLKTGGTIVLHTSCAKSTSNELARVEDTART